MSFGTIGTYNASKMDDDVIDGYGNDPPKYWLQRPAPYYWGLVGLPPFGDIAGEESQEFPRKIPGADEESPSPHLLT